MTILPDSPARLRLACDSCGEMYDAWRWHCACDESPDFATDPTPSAVTPDDANLDCRDGLWVFDNFLSIELRVSPGEGMTPLVDAAEQEASFKLEHVFLSGSFKDHSATTMLLLVSELGVEYVVEDSLGNAGAAAATYAARAGVDAEIYVPVSVKPLKVRATERAGAKLARVEGSRQAVIGVYVETVEADDAWCASHARNLAFFADTAIVACEIATQRDWLIPDAVATSLGHGALSLGTYRGFRTLYEAGWTDRMPELYGTQAAGYSPIADVRHHTADETNDVTDGIQILDPIREAEIHEALDTTGGDAIALSADVVENELGRFHRHGFYTEPTCAVVPAVLRELRLSGALGRDANVVVPLTGSGLKS